MRWLSRVVQRLRGVFSRSHAVEVHDELQLHLDLLTDELEAQGLPEAEARAQAQRTFGNATRLAERTREVSTIPWVEGLLKDVAYGVRQLRRHPLVTSMAIASLAIGIGANTAVFSIVSALVLRTLPVADPHRLAALSLGDHEATRVDGARWSYVFWKAFETHREQFDAVLAWSPTRVTVGTGDAATPVDGVFVDGGFFSALGTGVALGRPVGREDDRPGAPPVVVISHTYWQRAFGGAADVLGRGISVSGTTFDVVGVLRPEFTGLEIGQAADLVLPLSTEEVVRAGQSFLKPPLDAMNMWLRIGVRLRADQSLQHGTAIVQGRQDELREAALPPGFPQLRETFLRLPMSLVSAATGLSRQRQLYARPLAVLTAVAGTVLLLACLNVANLLLAQATARGPELGLRLALGGSQWRVARQLLVEAALLTTGGVAMGLVVAHWAARLLVAQFSSPTSPVSLDLGLDARVLVMTIVVAVISTLVCGTAAAWRVNAVSPTHAVSDVAHRAVGGQRARVSQLLLGGQVGLSLTLVIVAGLFLSTFSRLVTVPLGFDQDAVLIVSANASRTGVAPEERLALYERLLDTVRAAPGVAHAAASTLTPVSASFAPIGVRPVTAAGFGPLAEARSMFVTPDWFTTYGVPLLRGRDVGPMDTHATPPVMVVNRAFAERFFPARDALGEAAEIAIGDDGAVRLPRRVIVGVVDNAVYRSLREPPQPTAYFPLAQYDYPIALSGSIALSLRAQAGPPGALARNVSAAISQAHPAIAVTTRTLASQVRDSIRQEQLLATMSSLFGGIALLLAGIGLFGVTSYGVARRRGELAVRLAVGASRADVVRTVLVRLVAPVVVGIAAGLAMSTWLTRFVSSLLFGVAPGDPVTLMLACALLVAVAFAAAWVPLRHALRISPSEVLRAS